MLFRLLTNSFGTRVVEIDSLHPEDLSTTFVLTRVVANLSAVFSSMLLTYAACPLLSVFALVSSTNKLGPTFTVQVRLNKASRTSSLLHCIIIAVQSIAPADTKPHHASTSVMSNMCDDVPLQHCRYASRARGAGLMPISMSLYV